MGGSGDFIELETTKRQRCKSCNELITVGSLCISFERWRYPYSDVEAKIGGYFGLEEAMENEASIRMSEHYICEQCGEIYLNLQSVGFECISPSENMPKMLKQYQRDYAPPKLL
jgi:hypothetical protein